MALNCISGSAAKDDNLQQWLSLPACTNGLRLLHDPFAFSHATSKTSRLWIQTQRLFAGGNLHICTDVCISAAFSESKQSNSREMLMYSWCLKVYLSHSLNGDSEAPSAMTMARRVQEPEMMVITILVVQVVAELTWKSSCAAEPNGPSEASHTASDSQPAADTGTSLAQSLLSPPQLLLHQEPLQNG